MEIHFALIGCTALVVLWAATRAWYQSRDPLHPVCVLGLPLFAAYVVQPSYLLLTDAEGVYHFLEPELITYVLICNLIGVIAILVGASSRKVNSIKQWNEFVQLTSTWRLWLAGVVCGVLGVVGFLVGIINVGGFSVAYGSGYGGGWSDSGYIREASWLAIPAILLISVSRRRLTIVDIALVLLFSSPLVIHGFLGGRRGPTAAVFMTLFLARAFSTGWRPRIWQLVAGTTMIGLLMLVLVTYRNQITISGLQDLSNVENKGLDNYATKAGTSNEFIYGGGVVVLSYLQDICYMGGRYIAIVVIRPIPRAIFPNKYEFAAEWLGIPNLEEAGTNMGTSGLHFKSILGWRAANGAAPGLISDLWLEFSFGYVIALWVIGRFYWIGWSRAIDENDYWKLCYVTMLSLSFYLVTQTLEAMLFRFMLIAGAITIAYAVAIGRIPFDEILRGYKMKPGN